MDLAAVGKTFDGQRFTPEIILRSVRSQRLLHDATRLRHLQRSTFRWYRAGRTGSKPYLSLSSDYVPFAKALGLFEVRDGKIRSMENGQKLAALSSKNANEAATEALRLLLESKYKAYSRFLLALKGIGGTIKIPGNLRSRSRGSGLKGFLMSQGFFTDVASFYTIRDLHYDFDLLNWTQDLDLGIQEIYLASALSERFDEKFAKRCDTKEGSVSWWLRLSTADFRRELYDKYDKMTSNRFGRIVPLLELRDRVCRNLMMSDTQFNQSIIELSQEDRRVILSYGTWNPESSKGEVTKGANLPLLSAKRAANYVRIRMSA